MDTTMSRRAHGTECSSICGFHDLRDLQQQVLATAKNFGTSAAFATDAALVAALSGV